MDSKKRKWISTNTLEVATVIGLWVNNLLRAVTATRNSHEYLFTVAKDSLSANVQRSGARAVRCGHSADWRSDWHTRGDGEAASHPLESRVVGGTWPFNSCCVLPMTANTVPRRHIILCTKLRGDEPVERLSHLHDTKKGVFCVLLDWIINNNLEWTQRGGDKWNGKV